MPDRPTRPPLPRILSGIAPALAALLAPGAAADALGADWPNILWITCEDISPNIGCYGDDYATTPNIDRLATQGVRYTHAFAPIGVCAPSARTTSMSSCRRSSRS